MLEEMDGNRETILDELNDFEKHPVEICALLEDYLVRIAKTGDTMFPWTKLKPLLKRKAEIVLDEFYEMSPTDNLPTLPNVEVFKFDVLKNKILEAVEAFQSAPFTIQRICELLTNPRKHYKRADKFMRGLEKNILVVSTVEPSFGNEMNNNSASAVVNGMVSGENEQALTKGIDSPDISLPDKVNSPPPQSENIGDIPASTYIIVDETSEPLQESNSKDSEPEIDNKACMDVSSYTEASVHDNEEECYSDHHGCINKSTSSFQQQSNTNGLEQEIDNTACMDVSLYTEASMHEEEEEEDCYSNHHRNCDDKPASNSHSNAHENSSVEKFSSYAHSSSVDTSNLPQSDMCNLKDSDQKLSRDNDQRMELIDSFQHDSHSGLLRENVLFVASSVLVEDTSYIQKKQDDISSSPVSGSELENIKVHDIPHEHENDTDYKKDDLVESVKDEESHLEMVQSHVQGNCDQQSPEAFQHQPKSPDALVCQTQPSEKLECQPQSPEVSEPRKVNDDSVGQTESNEELDDPVQSSNEIRCRPQSPVCTDLQFQSSSTSEYMSQSDDNFMPHPQSPTHFKFRPQSPEASHIPHSTDYSCQLPSSNDLSHDPCSPGVVICQSKSSDKSNSHLDLSSNLNNQPQSLNEQSHSNDLKDESHHYDDLKSHPHSLCLPQSSDDTLHTHITSNAISQLQSDNDITCQGMSPNSLIVQPPIDVAKCQVKSENVEDNSVLADNYENSSTYIDKPLEPSPDEALIHNSNSPGNVCTSQCSDSSIPKPSLSDESSSQSENSESHDFSVDKSSFLQSGNSSLNQPQSPVYSDSHPQLCYSSEHAQSPYSADHALPTYSGDQSSHSSIDQSSHSSTDQSSHSSICPKNHEQSNNNFIRQLSENVYQNHMQPDSIAETAMEENEVESGLCGNTRSSTNENQEQEMMDVEYTLVKNENHSFAQNNCDLANEAEAMEEG